MKRTLYLIAIVTLAISAVAFAGQIFYSYDEAQDYVSSEIPEGEINGCVATETSPIKIACLSNPYEERMVIVTPGGGTRFAIVNKIINCDAEFNVLEDGTYELVKDLFCSSIVVEVY